MSSYDPEILSAMRGFAKGHVVPSKYDCGGPLDGWSLSPAAIRGHLDELREAIARAGSTS